MADEWSTLYLRMRSSIADRIREEAEKEDRTVAKWVEKHFREYFAEKDAPSCPPCTSPSSNTQPPSSD